MQNNASSSRNIYSSWRVFITGGSGFIGTNLIIELIRRGANVKNFDKSNPLLGEHRALHVSGDILEAEALDREISDFQPSHVVHLAARTDCDETVTVSEGYAVNTLGTQNLLDAVAKCPSVERLVVVSSQYVTGPGRLPLHDEDFFPHTVYGQSKVETERLTRSADLKCIWTIVRPVNIWGPYHMRYASEFWQVVRKGWYLHPGTTAPHRAYGYVGNVVWQMLELFNVVPEKISSQVFYVGEGEIPIDRWVFGFHQAIRGRPPLVIPYMLVRVMAFIGDIFSWISGRPFYINSSRLRSMTEDYRVDIRKTYSLLGQPPYSLSEGIEETVNWLRKSYWR